MVANTRLHAVTRPQNDWLRWRHLRTTITFASLVSDVVDIRDGVMPMTVEETSSFAWKRLGRGFVQRALALAVVLALIVLSYRLMRAPIHGVHTATDCARAYADARTYGEKLSADNLSFQDPTRPGVDMRCGMVRAGVVARARQ
ncbi:MAG TPA: hypothetical protein VNS10_10975 [Gemmatimonadaceae bacterium]|nr:hypothetical protein [Gemmatimonadaceae bacterium]